MKNPLRKISLLLALGLISATAFAAASKLPFAVYEDDMTTTPYIASGYMGNTAALAIDDKFATNPHTGKTCMKVTYSAGDNWGGVVWQSPANNWGEQDGGFDLTGAKKLTFWAKGDKGGEKVDFGFGLVGKDKKFGDSGKGDLKGSVLTTDWKQYTIDIKDQDMTHIITGFYFTLAGQGAPLAFYLDDIRFE